MQCNELIDCKKYGPYVRDVTHCFTHNHLEAVDLPSMGSAIV